MCSRPQSNNRRFNKGGLAAWLFRACLLCQCMLRVSGITPTVTRLTPTVHLGALWYGIIWRCDCHVGWQHSRCARIYMCRAKPGATTSSTAGQRDAQWPSIGVEHIVDHRDDIFQARFSHNQNTCPSWIVAAALQCVCRTSVTGLSSWSLLVPAWRCAHMVACILLTKQQMMPPVVWRYVAQGMGT